jgi:hypothetical protein
MALADTPTSNAEQQGPACTDPTGSVAPAHARDERLRRRQQAARDACYLLRQTGSAVSIGAWLEAPRVVLDLSAINSLCHGGRAAPVHERLTTDYGHLGDSARRCSVSMEIALLRCQPNRMAAKPRKRGHRSLRASLSTSPFPLFFRAPAQLNSERLAYDSTERERS